MRTRHAWKARTRQPREQVEHVRTIAGEPVAKPEQQTITRNHGRLTVRPRTVGERVVAGNRAAATVDAAFKGRSLRTAQIMHQVQLDSEPLRRKFG